MADQRLCPDGAVCREDCGRDCVRENVAADPPQPCNERGHGDGPCPKMAEGALPDRSVLWRVLGKTGSPLAIVRGCAFVLHEDNAHLSPVDLADLATILEFMLDEIDRDGL